MQPRPPLHTRTHSHPVGDSECSAALLRDCARRFKDAHMYCTTHTDMRYNNQANSTGSILRSFLFSVEEGARYTFGTQRL